MTKRFDPSNAALSVLTHKAGLLSAVAHDLSIRVGSFTFTLDDGGALELRVDAASLCVEHAMRDGAPAPELLSERDRRTIEASIRDTVLESRRYPEIAFSGRARDDGRVSGELSLHGTRRTLEAQARRDAAGWLAEVPLDQRDYGIRPYSAMLGTLRLDPVVRVRLRVPDVTL